MKIETLIPNNWRDKSGKPLHEEVRNINIPEDNKVPLGDIILAAKYLHLDIIAEYSEGKPNFNHILSIHYNIEFWLIDGNIL